MKQSVCTLFKIEEITAVNCYRKKDILKNMVKEAIKYDRVGNLALGNLGSVG